MISTGQSAKVLVCGMISLLLLAACGDTATSTPSSASTAASPAAVATSGGVAALQTTVATSAAVQTTSAASAAAAGSGATSSSSSSSTSDLLAQIKGKGVLRVANTQASPPWSMLNDKNQPEGYDVDVANDLAKRMGIPKVEFIASDFKSFILGIQSDKFDIAITGLSITDERKQQVEFSEPYEVNGVAIFVESSNSSIKSRSDLAGKKIAVSAGSTQEKFVRENIPTAEVKTYETATLALSDVSFGRADAALFSRYVGSYLASKNNLKVKPTQELLNVEVNAMALKKGQTAFKAEVDKALAAMVADGTLTTISKKWLGGLDMTEELKKLPK